MGVWTVAAFIAGVVLLIAGADMLVRGASRLAAAFGVSPLVIGLTVVAYGTGAPELAVSAQSSLAGQPDIALGNVVGSNIANVLLVLGLSAAVAPLRIDRSLMRFDLPVLLGGSALLVGLARDGHLGRLDGLVLLAVMAAYTALLVRQSRKEPPAIEQEYEEFIEEYAEPEDETRVPWYRDAVYIVAGLAALVLGADWVVGAASAFARALGVGELLIGLTIVAVGTSLPEAVTSVVASMRGERDLAVGNVVGSNLFNILAVLGLACLIAPRGIAVTPDAMGFDLPVMLAVAIVCVPIFLSHSMVARWEGFLLLGYYAIYVACLVLRAGKSPSLPAFLHLLAWFILPATAVLLFVSGLHSLRRGRAGSG